MEILNALGMIHPVKDIPLVIANEGLPYGIEHLIWKKVDMKINDLFRNGHIA